MAVGLVEVAVIVFQRHENMQAVVHHEPDEQGHADERQRRQSQAGGGEERGE